MTTTTMTATMTTTITTTTSTETTTKTTTTTTIDEYKGKFFVVFALPAWCLLFLFVCYSTSFFEP